MELPQIPQLLNETLSPDGSVVRAATESLDRLSLHPDFPFCLLSITTGGQNPGQRVAAATYLKNFTRRNVDGSSPFSKISKEFKNQLMRALLQVEPAVLKILVEVFRVIVASVFVKENSWPELVPELASVIQNSSLISGAANCEWNTINALTVLHSLIRPFQYFLNPKVPKEPVPPQLELLTKEILVPLLAVFHHFVEKALTVHGRTEAETERTLLLVCKCTYLAVRSHMPSALAPLLPSFCCDLFRILGSLSFDHMDPLGEGYLLRLKTGKRSLLIFCALVTRHRKFSDKLMPDIINCVLKIAAHSIKISKLDFLSERVVSLAFNVISHVLETGPGWRLVSPNFSSLLESAIFPALVMNEKDISEWEEDKDEYIQKNLPSDLEEISGWREDLFTARKSAINLLGVISMSKGPPVAASNCSSALSKRKKGEKNRGKDQRCFMGELLVIPFLSKFPIPSEANVSETKIINDYYGVLMAYGGLQDFLREQKPGYISTLIRNRVLPLYRVSVSLPYLVATANWVLGELASCLPEEMSADVYSSLLKALAMPDMGDVSCYPVRVSAAGAIAGLLENDVGVLTSHRAAVWVCASFQGSHTTNMARLGVNQRAVAAVAATSALVVCLGLVMMSGVGNAERLLKADDRPAEHLVNKNKEPGFLSKVVHFLWQSGKSSYQHVWPDMKFGWKLVVASIIGFFGAALGSVGGVGGGGIFVPMLTLIVGFDPKSSTAISKCMIMGAAGSTVYYNMRLRHPTLDMPIIDYDLALLFQPMLMLGISIGVAFNVIFADWMVTVLLIILFLGTSTKALFKGIETWKKETIMKKEAARLLEAETKPTDNTGGGDYRPLPSGPATIRDDHVPVIYNICWKELALLVYVWVAFLAVQIVKTYTVTCSIEYWVLNCLQVPIAASVSIYEAVCLYKGTRVIASKGKEVTNWKIHQIFLYCSCGIVAGLVGGLLGLGGGFILGPLFLELGIPPQVASATSTFSMAFSSSMSVVQYHLLRRFPVPYASYFVLVATIAALVGQHVVRKVIKLVGRASIIIFILALTIFISAISLGGVGIMTMVEKLANNEYMGFDDLCYQS